MAYKGLLKGDLLKLCEEKGIKCPTRLKKDEIVALLEASGTKKKVTKPLVVKVPKTTKKTKKPSVIPHIHIVKNYIALEKPYSSKGFKTSYSTVLENYLKIYDWTGAEKLEREVAVLVSKGKLQVLPETPDKPKRPPQIIFPPSGDTPPKKYKRPGAKKSPVQKKVVKKRNTVSRYVPGVYKPVEIMSVSFGKKGEAPPKKSKKPARIAITLEELRKEVDNPEFIKRFTQSSRDLMAAKEVFYKKRYEDAKKEHAAVKLKVDKLRNAGISSKTIDDMYPNYPTMAAFMIDLEGLAQLVKKKGETVTEEEIKEGLIDAIDDVDDGISSLIGRTEIKNQLASQLYSFSKGYKTFIGSFNNISIYGSAGVGKCLHPDTPVLMYNGSTKRAEDVVEGDLLMGDDSTPRIVMSICSGEDNMYKITPTKGDSYTVNEPHILSLRRSYKPKLTWSADGRYRVDWCDQKGKGCTKSFTLSKYESKDDALLAAQEFKDCLPDEEIVIDISVEDYIKKSVSWKKMWKGYRVGVDFEETEELAVDAYLIGLWLGDGSSAASEITNIDVEIIEYMKEEAKKMGMYVRAQKMTNGEDGITYYMGGNKHCVNPFLKELQANDMIKNKHIPMKYKTSSRDNRLRLLAGLIDSDGSLSGGCYDIIQKSDKLAEDILFVARSCGFAAYSNKCKKGCWYKNEYKEAEYNRIIISGNISDIPVLLSRKKAKGRKQIKDVLNVGITVTPVGRGKYCGFELDGNHRFLLGDFTVTHNTRLAQVIGYAFSKAGILATDNVKIVTRTELIGQYIGQTAPQTRSVLLETLEGVLFIDEAYQLTQCPEDKVGSKDFGSESVTEIVNFLDKYIGMSIVIVAGYEGVMTRCFMTFNEGLPRRFPYRYILSPYPDEELTDILISNLKRKIPGDVKIDDATSNFLYSMVVKIRTELPDAFKNQAGDMLNLSAYLNKAITSSFKIKWKNGDLANNIPILLSGFDDFLGTKGYSVYD